MEKKERFKKLKGKLKGSKGGTKPMLDADKNPKKFMKENQNPSIKGLKGVAF